jgi:hypothetical protein
MILFIEAIILLTLGNVLGENLGLFTMNFGMDYRIDTV